MASTYQSWFKTTLSLKLNPSDVTMSVATAPVITAGRVFIDNGAQQEWIQFTWVTPWTPAILTGLTRWLSQTNDPATTGTTTGKQWIAWTQVKIVAMHDQLLDKALPQTINAAWTYTKNLILSWVDAILDLSGAKKWVVFPNLTTTERLALTPANGMMVYDTTLWMFYQYKNGSRANVDTWTLTPNATSTIAWSVQLQKPAVWSDVGSTWAPLVTMPSDLVATYDSTFLAWEAIIAWQPVFIETIPTTAQATTKRNICDNINNTRISMMVIWAWVPWNTFKLNLCKTWSPAANLNFRIETDNAGSPSGTLAAPLATSAVTEGSLTTSLADTSVTLDWTVTLDSGTKYHIVMFQWTYWSETISASNYYNIWDVTNGSTTRPSKKYNGTARSTALLAEYYDFTGSTIDTNVWLTTWTVTQNWYMEYQPWGWAFMATNFRTVKDYLWDMDVRCNMVSTYNNWWPWSFTAMMVLYFDATNYMRIYEISCQWSSRSYLKVEVVKNWVQTYTASTGNFGYRWTLTYNLRIQYEKNTWKVRFYYSTWTNLPTTQIWTEHVSSFTWNTYKVVFTSADTWSGWLQDVKIDNLYINNYVAWVSWTTSLPYSSSTLFLNNVLALTDANFSYKTNLYWISSDTVAAWAYPKITVWWINSNQTWLTYWTNYYLWAIQWSISSTPWTYWRFVWVWINATKMKLPTWIIWNVVNAINISYTWWSNNNAWNYWTAYRNITLWLAQVYSTNSYWGSCDTALQISADWVTYTTVWSSGNSGWYWYSYWSAIIPAWYWYRLWSFQSSGYSNPIYLKTIQN